MQSHQNSSQSNDNNVDDESSPDISAIRRRIESLLAASGAEPAGRRRIRSATAAGEPPADTSARRRASAPLSSTRLSSSSSSSDSGPDTPPESEESSNSANGSEAFVRRADFGKAKGIGPMKVPHVPKSAAGNQIRTDGPVAIKNSWLSKPSEYLKLAYNSAELPNAELTVANISESATVGTEATVPSVSPVPVPRGSYRGTQATPSPLPRGSELPEKTAQKYSANRTPFWDESPITVAESDKLLPATIHLQLLSPVPAESVQQSLQSLINPAESAGEETKWRYEPTPSPRASDVGRSAKEKSWHSADDISMEAPAEYLSVDSGFQRSANSIPAPVLVHRRANSGSATIPRRHGSPTAGSGSIASFSSSSSIHSKASETQCLDFAVESDREDRNQDRDNGFGQVNVLRRSPDLAEWNELYLIRCLNAIQDPDALSQAEIESLMDAGALLPIDRLLSKRPELASESLSLFKRRLGAVQTINGDSSTDHAESTELKIFPSQLDDKIQNKSDDKFVDKSKNEKMFMTHFTDSTGYGNQRDGVNKHKGTYCSEPILNAKTYSEPTDDRQIWYGKENAPAHRKIRSDSSVRAPPPPYEALAAARRFGRRPCHLVRSSGTQTEANDLGQTARKPRRCVVGSTAPKTNPTWARNSAAMSIFRREQQMIKQQQQHQQYEEKQRWDEKRGMQNKIQQQEEQFRQQQEQERQKLQLRHQQQERQQQLRLQQIQQRRQDGAQQRLLQQQTHQRLKEQQMSKVQKKPQRRPVGLYHSRPVMALDEEDETDTFIRFIDKQGREIAMSYLVSEDEDPRQWRQFVAQQRTPAPGNTASRNHINADAKMQIIHNVDENNNGKPQRPVIQSLSRPNDYHSKSFSKTTNGAATPPIMTVSGSHCCAHCDAPLGRGAAMIVEALNLFYHLSCFRCNVCSMALGNGTRGADVQVRGHRLYCQKCFCDD